MVIHNENDLPVEMAVIKKPLFEQESSIFNKDHVQKSTNKFYNRHSSTESTMNTTAISVKSKRSKKREPPTSAAENMQNSCDISAEDLLELKTIYEKCKAVIKKIETKYGHLLDLEVEEPTHKRRKYNEETDSDTCQCTLNKKIVFDDEGKESTVETTSDNHICPRKIQKHTSSDLESGTTNNPTEKNSVTVEYTTESLQYPDNLKELSKLLQNSNSEITYREQQINRNLLVQKAYELKQEYLNEIKLNKPFLIEQLKKNSDELLMFKGTNLSALPGYFCN